jgi:rRNA-processing protein FCF1
MAADRHRGAEGLRGGRSVVLDSNFLFVPLKFGVDIFAELERLLGPSVECITLKPVLDELALLREGAPPSLAREIEFASELAGRCRVLHDQLNQHETVDDLILRVASESGYIVATNDAELRRRLKEEGVPAVYLRQRAYLEVEGYVPGLG